MLKIIAALCAVSLGSAVALAQQQTPPPPPTGPSAAECQQGWKADSKWSQQEFVSACAKIREGQKN